MIRTSLMTTNHLLVIPKKWKKEIIFKFYRRTQKTLNMLNIIGIDS